MKPFEDGWVQAPLEKLTSLIKDGSHGTHKDMPDGVPLLSAKDVRDGELEIPSDCRRISEADYAAIHKNYEIVPNDILLTVVGTIGRCYLMKVAEPRFSIQRSVAVIRSNGVQPKYLYHFFRSELFQTNLKNLTNASAQGGVYLGSLAKCFVKFPTAKAEQAKISEILSTVDRAIEQTETLIDKQQRIKTGLMQDLLTRGIDEHGNLRTEQTHKFKDSPLGRIPVEWEVVPVEQKLTYIIDYRGRTPVKEDSGIPLITAKNVREGFLNEEPREFIAEKNYEAWMTRGIPTPGDVMFTTEAPMGNVARVPEYKIALAQRLITLPTKDAELSSTYLFWLLHWARTTERLELLTSGSTVVGVKQSTFRKVLFRFPEKDEQARITQVLEAHNAISLNEKTKLQKLRSLKTALMQDLLTGKKRVADLVDEIDVLRRDDDPMKGVSI